MDYRSNRTSWSLGRLLLFNNLKDQTGKGNQHNGELEQLLISNFMHNDHPLPKEDRGQEGSPPEKGGHHRLPLLAAPGTLAGTINIIPHNLTNYK